MTEGRREGNDGWGGRWQEGREGEGHTSWGAGVGSMAAVVFGLEAAGGARSEA